MKKLFLLMLIIFISCDNDDDSLPLCLEAPPGEIIPDAINLTVFTELGGLESITVFYENGSTDLELNSLDVGNQVFFSCWQEAPTLAFTNASIVVAANTIEVINIENGSNSNLVSLNLIEIEGELILSLQDYTECEDVVNN